MRGTVLEREIKKSGMPIRQTGQPIEAFRDTDQRKGIRLKLLI